MSVRTAHHRHVKKKHLTYTARRSHQLESNKHDSEGHGRNSDYSSRAAAAAGNPAAEDGKLRNSIPQFPILCCGIMYSTRRQASRWARPPAAPPHAAVAVAESTGVERARVAVVQLIDERARVAAMNDAARFKAVICHWHSGWQWTRRRILPLLALAVHSAVALRGTAAHAAPGRPAARSPPKS